MRVLIVGAGASFDEGRRQGFQPDKCLPLIKNFAKSLWQNNPGFYPYLLYEYMDRKGLESEGNPLKKFVDYSESYPEEVNIEDYFEFIWSLKQEYSGLKDYLSRIRPNGRYEPPHENWESLWYQLLFWGIGAPLNFAICQTLKLTGEFQELRGANMIIEHLKKGDVVLNLNYDTLFEIGLQQSQKRFTYAPNKRNYACILVAKPHGSLNRIRTRIFDKYSVTFAHPDIYGAGLPSGQESYTEIFAPRKNKNYEQSPTSKIIIDSVKNLKPHKLTFWGVGFTASDIDLLELYSNWASQSQIVELINPDPQIAKTISELLKISASKITHYLTLESFVESQN